MTTELIKLIKETWVDYFTGAETELLKNMDADLKTSYKEAMIRLETDFEFQQELGIGD